MIPKVSPVRSDETPAAVPGNVRLRSEVSRKNKTSIPSLPRKTEKPAKIESEQKWNIEGVVSKGVKAKLDRCKSLLLSKYPQRVDDNILPKPLKRMCLRLFVDTINE